jgi:hypothetical protein
MYCLQKHGDWMKKSTFYDHDVELNEIPQAVVAAKKAGDSHLIFTLGGVFP